MCRHLIPFFDGVGLRWGLLAEGGGRSQITHTGPGTAVTPLPWNRPMAACARGTFVASTMLSALLSHPYDAHSP